MAEEEAQALEAEEEEAPGLHAKRFEGKQAAPAPVVGAAVRLARAVATVREQLVQARAAEAPVVALVPAAALRPID
jgi:hypothetical protein